MKKKVISQTSTEVLSDIPVKFDVDKVLRRLKIGNRVLREKKEPIKNLINMATGLITPRATYKVAYIENKKDAAVEIEKVEFESKVLRKNLDKIERVFPYVITIGKKLEDKVATTEDLLEQYYLEEIADIALDYIREYLEKYLQEKYRLEQLSRMSPGSLKDWPITEQQKFFSLFGDTQKLTGVTLTDSFLMIPRKSVSGIFFPTDVKFYSCQLCPKEGCIRRKAPYDSKLARSYGIYA